MLRPVPACSPAVLSTPSGSAVARLMPVSQIASAAAQIAEAMMRYGAPSAPASCVSTRFVTIAAMPPMKSITSRRFATSPGSAWSNPTAWPSATGAIPQEQPVANKP